MQPRHKYKDMNSKLSRVSYIKAKKACLHGGGGPQADEITRLGGVRRQSIYFLILIWSRLHDRWGDLPRRVAWSANPLSRGQILPCKLFKVS